MVDGDEGDDGGMTLAVGVTVFFFFFFFGVVSVDGFINSGSFRRSSCLIFSACLILLLKVVSAVISSGLKIMVEFDDELHLGKII